MRSGKWEVGRERRKKEREGGSMRSECSGEARSE
jgi:hypothetical protein